MTRILKNRKRENYVKLNIFFSNSLQLHECCIICIGYSVKITSRILKFLKRLFCFTNFSNYDILLILVKLCKRKIKIKI